MGHIKHKKELLECWEDEIVLKVTLISQIKRILRWGTLHSFKAISSCIAIYFYPPIYLLYLFHIYLCLASFLHCVYKRSSECDI